jgi:hypothetical protein
MTIANRGTPLLHVAQEQIDKLSGLLSAAGDAAMRLPCPGRERLGDGTVGAAAAHTADSYRRLARFLQGMRQPSDHDPANGHGPGYSAHDISLAELLARLTAAREALAPLATLTHEQLGAVPSETEMRFADGKRTLEQVVVSVLKHQRHQIDAIEAAIRPTSPRAVAG